MLKKILKLGRQKLWTIHRDYLREKHELNYLFWECTLNCNFQCKHCGSRAGEKFIKETLNTEEIKNAFLNVAQNYDANKITIAVTGGEPLLRKDLFEVMEYASSLGFAWGMVTNAFLVNEEIVEKAKKAKMRTIDISIDGLEDIHDEFRGTKGSFRQALNAIKLFQKADFLNPLRVTTTVHKKNIKMLDEMYGTFMKTGLKDWRILSVDPIGRTIDNDDIQLEKEDYITILNFIKNKRKENSEIKITSGCAHYLGDEFEDEVRNHFFYCSTGINVGSILHNGDIYVCPNVPRIKELIQGNVKIDSFNKIWDNKYEFFRDKNQRKCEECNECQNWSECLGDSMHTWDFDNKRPKVCLMRENVY